MGPNNHAKWVPDAFRSHPLPGIRALILYSRVYGVLYVLLFPTCTRRKSGAYFFLLDSIDCKYFEFNIAHQRQVRRGNGSRFSPGVDSVRS